jgi:molybdopterin molybdotransferase
VPDNLDDTIAALRRALAECDAVVTTGGVSVGEMDFVKAAFTQIGGTLDFWKVDMRPGRPFTFGKCRGKPFFGVPGNPVSAFVTFVLLVRPALCEMQGAPPAHLSVAGTLAERVVNGGERRHFVRAIRNGAGQVRLAGPQASHLLGSLARSVCLLDVPPQTSWPAGQKVKVLYW